MKRIVMGLATALGLSVCGNTAPADPGGFSPPGGPNGSIGFPNMAQTFGPDTLLGAGATPGGRPPDRFGLHPCIKKLFHIPQAGVGGYSPYGSSGNPIANPANWAAAGYGRGGPGYNPQGFPPQGYGPAGYGPGPGPYGPAAGPYGAAAGPYGAAACAPGYGGPMMQGTLVFPNNQFIRSPRDYFMVDVNNK